MNLEEFYTHLQDQTDATIVEGIGTVPARVMLILGQATAFATMRNQLDTGAIKAYLNFIKDIAPRTYSSMYTTFLLKNRNAEFNSHTIPNINDEWEAIGKPNIVIYVGASGAYYGEGPDSDMAFWVPGINETMSAVHNSQKHEQVHSAWVAIEQAYKETYG